MDMTIKGADGAHKLISDAIIEAIEKDTACKIKKIHTINIPVGAITYGDEILNVEIVYNKTRDLGESLVIDLGEDERTIWVGNYLTDLKFEEYQDEISLLISMSRPEQI